jgi:hypothetical protein
MWKSLFLTLCIFLLTSSCFAQERAFSSAPIYSLTFDTAATSPAGCEYQAGRGANLGLCYFNGVSNFVMLNTTNDVNNRAFPSLDSSFTIEAWMSYENFQSYSHWISLGNGAYRDNIFIGNTGTGNAVRFGTVYNFNATNYVEKYVNRPNAYSVGVFSHIVATVNLISTSDTTSAAAAMLNLYVNGAWVANITQYNTQLVQRSQQFLGRSNWQPDALFNGWIDSLHIYNYPLSDQSVFAHRYLQRVPVYELAFSEDPRQIAGSSATYGFVVADPADVTANVSQWHQGVVTLNGQNQYMDLTVNSGSSTAGTTLPTIGGNGFGTGSNNFEQGWSFEFAFKTPQVNANSKIFDAAASGSDRISLGFDGNSALVFYVSSGTTGSSTTVLSSVTTNTWYHVLVVVVPNSAAGTNRAIHRVYVNGVATLNNTEAYYPSSVSRSTAYIGKSTSSSETAFAYITFDLVRIYDYAISAQTALRLYYSVSQPAPEDPVPPPTLYSTHPTNVFGFTNATSNTPAAYYQYIENTNDGHFGVAAFNGRNTSVNLLYYPDEEGKFLSNYIGGGSMSFSIWAKWLATPQWSRILDFAGRLAELDSNIIICNSGTTANLAFQIYSGPLFTEVTVDQGITPGAWQHIVAVVEQVSNNITSPIGANLKLYINGVLRASRPGYIPPRVARSNLLVGRSNFNNDARFAGYMDSIAFYEYALNEQQILAHACTNRPPVFEFAFTRDPRTIELGVAYNYGWLDSEVELIPAGTPVLNPSTSNITFTHTGLLTFNGNGQYVNLTATSGPQSIGTSLPIIGGPGSGVGIYTGWTFEVLVKFNALPSWSKIFDFGVNANGDDDIILGMNGSGALAFEVWNNGTNNATRRATVYPNPAVGQWYHIVCILTPTDLGSNLGRMVPYVNGEVRTTSTINWPRTIPRKNANVGKSNWQDAYFNGTIDSLRIYDYAISEDSVVSLYRASRSIPPRNITNPLYHAGPRNNYAFTQGYDPAQSAIANFQWRQSYDGHDGVAYFDGTNQFVNLLGFSDTNGRNFPLQFGGTDLTFAGWVRYDTLRGYSRIFDISNGQGTLTLAFMNIGNTAQPGIHLYNANANTAFNLRNYNFTTNAWFHYAIVIKRNPSVEITANNAATTTLYINGAAVESSPSIFPGVGVRSQVYLGRSGWSADQYFNGAMDTFSWYDYALPLESVSLHASLITPPAFELTFSEDPRTAATGPVANTFDYSWVASNPEDGPNTVHRGLLDLTRASNHFVDLSTPVGTHSLGTVLPSLGGLSSGSGATYGWSFEAVFRLRNVSSSYNFCKVFNTGNGANEGGLLGDDNIALGLRENGLFAFEILNSRTTAQTIVPILTSAQANTWYSVVVTVQLVDAASFTASYSSYVNGALVNSTIRGSYLQGISRQNAFLGKSEWANDPLCDMQLDAIRIYDYVLTSSQVSTLASRTVDTTVPIFSSTGSPAPTSTGPSVSSTVVPPPASSTGPSSVVDIGCKIPPNRRIPEGSVKAAVMINKPLNQFPTNFGTVFLDALSTTVGLTNYNYVGCSGARDGSGVITNAEPAVGQTKVEFYFFNDDGLAQQKYDALSKSFSTFQANLVQRLDPSYAPQSLENVGTGNNSGGSSSGLSGGAIAGIVIGVIVGVILLIGLAYFFLRSGRGKSYDYNNKHQTATHSYDTHNDDHDVEHEHETNEEEVEMTEA